MEQNIPYTLLAKYFANQSSENETEDVRQWREQSPENERTFTDLQNEWNEIHANKTLFVVPDKTKVWNTIVQRISKTVQPVIYTKNTLYRAVAIAASIALLVGLSASFLLSGLNSFETGSVAENVIIAPIGQKSQLQLPDGSKVWLNSGSKLTYATNFSLSQREVNLEGEAFFDVVHDKAHIFIVKAGPVDVKVHGTSFSVSNYKTDAAVSVALVRGSVSVEASGDHELLAELMPGQKAEVVRSSENCTVSAFDAESHNVWMLNKLQFKGEAVYDVFKKVERWYGVKVRLVNEDPAYCYWFTLKTESLTELLNLINKITPIDYTVNGEEVTIRYKR